MYVGTERASQQQRRRRRQQPASQQQSIRVGFYHAKNIPEIVVAAAAAG